MSFKSPSLRHARPANAGHFLYLEVKRECGLGDAIHFIHELGWTVREVKEYPSGRPDVLAVRMDLETDQALRDDVQVMNLMKDLDSVVRLEM